MSFRSTSLSLSRLARLTIGAAGCSALAGCDDPVASSRPRVRSVYIVPVSGTLSPGTSGQMQYQADADVGADTTVRWTSAPSPAGSISPTGFLRTCFPGGVLTVVVQSVAEPSKVDTLPIAVSGLPIGWAAVSDLSRPNPSTPRTAADFVDAGAVNGDVEFEVQVSGSLLARGCRAVRLVELHLTNAATHVVVARFPQATPFVDDRRFRARVPTAAVPDGEYQLGAAVHLTDVATPVPALPLRVTIRNR